MRVPGTLVYLTVKRVQGRVRLFRGWLFGWRVRFHGGRAGRGIYVDAGLHLRSPPHAGWRIGSGTYFGYCTVLDAPGELEIADGARIMQHSTVASVERVVIGRNAQIAENCSVRDHNHDVAAPSMSRAPVVASPVTIGDDAWIGRGAAVLAGVTVGAGAVVGANAVVTRDVAPGYVATGVPARAIRLRTQAAAAAEGARRDQS